MLGSPPAWAPLARDLSASCACFSLHSQPWLYSHVLNPFYQQSFAAVLERDLRATPGELRADALGRTLPAPPREDVRKVPIEQRVVQL